MNAFMATHFRSILVLLTAGITACLAQSAIIRDKSVRRFVEPILENHRLPYSGFGRVTLVDDASIIVRLGGEAKTSFEEVDGEIEERIDLTPYDTFVIEFDSTDVSLVRAGNHVALDRSGVETAKRGLSSDSVFRTAFPSATELKKSTTPPTIMAEFSGPMSAALDRASGMLRVRITDTESLGHSFEYSVALRGGDVEFPITSDGVSAENGAIPARLAGPYRPRGGGDSGGVESARSVQCNNGSGSVTCKSLGCYCVCTPQGEPRCECVSGHCDL